MTSSVYKILNDAKRLNPFGTIMEEMWNYVRFALFIVPFRSTLNHRRHACRSVCVHRHNLAQQI